MLLSVGASFGFADGSSSGGQASSIASSMSIPLILSLDGSEKSIEIEEVSESGVPARGARKTSTSCAITGAVVAGLLGGDIPRVEQASCVAECIVGKFGAETERP